MIAILGAGAFGAALALALEGEVKLWGRGLSSGARCAPRLPGHEFPERVSVATSPSEALSGADLILLAVPMKALRETAAHLMEANAPVIACCKGIDPETGLGPARLLRELGVPNAGSLTGPSFASDIAQGLPTALTLALADGAEVQRSLSGRTLRLYRTGDVVGAELGGALKNVLAIASGAVIGAGLGQSAQAAILARGFRELRDIAEREGAETQTLLGLSGMGDLMLTAYSSQSRNFRYGHALGCGEVFGEDATVEGVFTARAVALLAERHGLDLPVLAMTQSLISGDVTITRAVDLLMTRPLKEE
ncbi:MAG: NAD(P)H-dependent glycerol-3-phosphate dehydrogenase [Pseudomonadota bacterium]